MNENKQVVTRDGFKSKFGIIAAAAGSAIGLGNVWRFPYMTGKYGGAAFLIIYLICIVIVGFPVLLSELIIGRRSQKNVVDAFHTLRPGSKWYISGAIGLTASFVIMTTYCNIAGWTLKYITLSITNQFSGLSAEQITTNFNGFTAGVWQPIIFALVIMSIAGVIVAKGVHNGIEAASKVIMPALVVMLLMLVGRAVTLDGAMKGVKFLLMPDWSSVNGATILAALGHAFFSVSLGQGIMVTYGSYISKKENLLTTAASVCVADTVIAIFAGLAIFPAVFALGLQPDSGPSLIFITLPNLFNQMPGGALFAVIFFVFLSFAAISSIISNVEVVVAYLVEKRNMKRYKAAFAVTTAITGVGLLSALSLGPWKTKFLGMNFMDFSDWISSNFLLPLVGILFISFVAWILGNKQVEDELHLGQTPAAKFVVKAFMFLIKFITPVIIIIIFLNGIGVL